MIYDARPTEVNNFVRTDLSLSTIGILTGIVLCILKATNVLSISWFWATFPFWIVPAVSLGLLLIGVVVLAIAFAVENKRRL